MYCRITDDTICLHHPAVSKRHAEILQKGGLLTFRDLESTNGTHVNGECKPPEEPRTLNVHDRVIIGRYELQVMEVII